MDRDAAVWSANGGGRRAVRKQFSCRRCGLCEVGLPEGLRLLGRHLLSAAGRAKSPACQWFLIKTQLTGSFGAWLLQKIDART